jgi:anti-sigma factor RsiW
MDRTVSAAHASHDELLIARLFGDDVDEPERARALELIAECTECAALFADLGAIADADAAMPVPPRPRDFTLTEADAARLRRKRHVWSPIFGAGLRRSLGSSLAAIGLAGALLTGVASMFGGTASSATALLSDQRAAEPIAVAAAPASTVAGNGADFSSSGAGAGATGSTAGPALVPGRSAVPVASPVPVAAGSIAAETTPAVSPSDVGGKIALRPPAPSATSAHEASRAPSQIAVNGANPQTNGAKSANSDGTTPSGVDPRLLWFGGFGALFALGLVITLLPLLSRGRGRGRGRGTRA